MVLGVEINDTQCSAAFIEYSIQFNYNINRLKSLSLSECNLKQVFFTLKLKLIYAKHTLAGRECLFYISFSHAHHSYVASYKYMYTVHRQIYYVCFITKMNDYYRRILL